MSSPTYYLLAKPMSGTTYYLLAKPMSGPTYYLLACGAQLGGARVAAEEQQCLGARAPGWSK